MRRFSRFGLALVLSGLVALAWWKTARADVRVGTLPTGSSNFKTIVVTGNSGNAAMVPNTGVGTIIYGFSVIPNSATNIVCGLYDVTTASTTTLVKGNVIDEGGSDTQYRPFQSNWPAPYKTVNGLYVHINSTSVQDACIIYVGA